MRILLTNDDGIHANGLQVLKRIAQTLSDDVWIVAPETDQSGQARSLTLAQPLRVREVDSRTFAVNGTPTDCVIMGVRSLVPDSVDLVLSGVNEGQNIGDAVLYSGTVAGAMEGAFLGIRSVALSQAYAFDGNRTVLWDTVERGAPDILRQLLDLTLPPRTMINVNFPNCAYEDLGPPAVVSQGKFDHALHVDNRRDGRGLPYSWLQFRAGTAIEQTDTDISALAANQVAITPLQLDLTNRSCMDTLKRVLTREVEA